MRQRGVLILFMRNLFQELKTFASELYVDDRIKTVARKPAFISLKGHKENFKNNTKCHLINPAKSDLSKVSKVILDRINTSIQASTGVNPWRNSTSVTEWFSKICEEFLHTGHRFVSFYCYVLPSLDKVDNNNNNIPSSLSTSSTFTL